MTPSPRSFAHVISCTAIFGALFFTPLQRGQSSEAEAATGVKTAIPEMQSARQLVVIKTANWASVTATIELFERHASGRWESHAGPFPAVVGRNGLRWGLGLHGSAPSESAEKREGDDCAPAGVFRLGEVFGAAAANATRFLKLPYVMVTDDLEAVDDSNSRHYNRLVHRNDMPPDWRSSEKMRAVGGFYRWGVVVRHNWEQKPDHGSCIFLHLWGGPAHGTAGCTAFAPETMETLLRWLDGGARPLLVQLPVSEFAARRQSWGLP
jgi:zinc D-Ala-D-Ala dipeptidase